MKRRIIVVACGLILILINLFWIGKILNLDSKTEVEHATETARPTNLSYGSGGSIMNLPDEVSKERLFPKQPSLVGTKLGALLGQQRAEWVMEKYVSVNKIIDSIKNAF